MNTLFFFVKTMWFQNTSMQVCSCGALKGQFTQIKRTMSLKSGTNSFYLAHSFPSLTYLSPPHRGWTTIICWGLLKHWQMTFVKVSSEVPYSVLLKTVYLMCVYSPFFYFLVESLCFCFWSLGLFHTLLNHIKSLCQCSTFSWICTFLTNSQPPMTLSFLSHYKRG